MHTDSKFIIETHSDYIIDRFRTAYRDNKVKPENADAQVVFFERTAKGNRLYPIEILPDGELSEGQPKGYREFFLREQMKIMGF